jgi:hypothetical protein
MLAGLPDSGSWAIFKQITEGYLDPAHGTSATTFSTICAHVRKECICLEYLPNGSAEFANVTAKHGNCLICGNCKQPGHHEDHCWQKGRKLEGQGPRRPPRPPKGVLPDGGKEVLAAVFAAVPASLVEVRCGAVSLEGSWPDD